MWGGSGECGGRLTSGDSAQSPTSSRHISLLRRSPRTRDGSPRSAGPRETSGGGLPLRPCLGSPQLWSEGRHGPRHRGSRDVGGSEKEEHGAETRVGPKAWGSGSGRGRPSPGSAPSLLSHPVPGRSDDVDFPVPPTCKGGGYSIRGSRGERCEKPAPLGVPESGDLGASKAVLKPTPSSAGAERIPRCEWRADGPRGSESKSLSPSPLLVLNYSRPGCPNAGQATGHGRGPSASHQHPGANLTGKETEAPGRAWPTGDPSLPRGQLRGALHPARPGARRRRTPARPSGRSKTAPNARAPSTGDRWPRAAGPSRKRLRCRSAPSFHFKIEIPSDVLIISISVSTLRFWQHSLGSLGGKHIFLYHF